jgi:hypothetical protein
MEHIMDKKEWDKQWRAKEKADKDLHDALKKVVEAEMRRMGVTNKEVRLVLYPK